MGSTSRPLMEKLWAVDFYKRMYLRELARMLREGFDADTIQVEGEPLVFRPRTFDTPGLVAHALANRSELTVLSARSSQAEKLLQLRKHERYP